MTTTHTFQRRRLTVTGQVQGVGFRPLVYRLAAEMCLTGWVRNDPAGVTIEIQGRPAAIEAFPDRLAEELPPLASMATLDVAEAEVMTGESRFEIRPSEGGELTDAQVTVDTATCPDCLSELFDPDDPRHGYPFINCTNCGPRYTIVRRIPYDRPNTTMGEFGMCGLCSRQYGDPADRRFHAQPVACERCGPHVWLVDPQGKQIDAEDPITAVGEMLLDGAIVAVRGLGGFHLACRADDEAAVRRLRDRKHREAKPLAMMVRDMEQVRELCDVPPHAEELLTGPLRPIVLLRRRDDEPPPGVCRVAPAVAAGLDTLGIMLPYTPVHYLLFAHVDRPLVMTSANLSREPLVRDNDEALNRLGRLADAMLLHNRDIQRRLDDSVVQWTPLGPCVLRRARGYAPAPVRIHCGTDGDRRAPAVLAVGAELKSAVCLYRDGQAVLGEHIGDLKDGPTYRHFIDTVHHLEELFDVAPEAVAADLHPQMLSTDYAMRRHRGELPGRPALPLVRVQHHHAHAAACLAENARTDEALALVCDGVGYGDDGAVWGCEVFRCDLAGYERLGHLRYLPLPGGDRAAEQCHRPAVAALYDALGPAARGHPVVERLALTDEAFDAALELLTAGANCPPASSLGRWFDAVAFLCGVARENRFEGEAPMRLEAVADNAVTGAYPWRMADGWPMEIDLRPMVVRIADEISARVPAAAVSARFHNTVADFLHAAAVRARERTGLATVALSGGCFANRRLTARLADRLTAGGFEVLTHRTVPPNDGGIALGQAVCAAARLARAKH